MQCYIEFMLFGPLVCFALGSWQQSTANEWVRVRVDVQDVATLDRLANSAYNVLNCVPVLGHDDVVLPISQLPKLAEDGYTYQVVGKVEDPRNWQARHSTHVSRITDDYRYHYYNADQILEFYETLRTEYPQVISRKSIGTTIKGETMWAYRFKPTGPAINPPNNIVIQSLIHAREWITGASVMHIARKLAELYSGPLLNSSMASQAVWIIPMANPDGYRYTWTNDRYWRKNRRKNSGSSYGVDLNRNYAKGWGGSGGSSGNGNSETYRGTAAFSEPETVAIRDFLGTLPRVRGFIDYHSFSQLILQPWGYTTAPAPDQATLDFIGGELQTKMSAFGADYEHGETSNILYVASGTSNDWVYDTYRAPALGIELRDTGDFGFELPESQIYVSQDEVWAGFRRYLDFTG